MSKQDRQGVRQASDLEQKYNFGKSFAEIMGVATDARKKAEEAQADFSNLDSQEIYNILTNNGESQGLYRADNGDLYVNAKYLYALEELFAKDISMSGKFTHTAEIYLEPEQEEIDKIRNHILDIEYIPIDDFPLYDFNNDGELDGREIAFVKTCMLGLRSVSEWSGAKTSTVTLTIDLKNPYKAICIKGKNMWGREIEKYIGIGMSSITTCADYVVEEGESNLWTYRKWNSGIVELWTSVSVYTALTDQLGSTAGHYWGSYFDNPDYPFWLYDANVQFTPFYSGTSAIGVVMRGTYAEETKPPAYAPYTFSKVTEPVTITGRYYVMARWK